MRLALVRHGESAWNREHRLQGQIAHVPLTALGLAQAGEAAASLQRSGWAGAPVWTSDLLRATQTADVVAGALGSRVTATPLLREQALGALEGRLTAELAAQPTPAGVDVSEVAWGGGESIEQLHRRCLRLLTELDAALPPGEPRAVLIGHGDALRVLLAVLDGVDHRHVDWFPMANAEVLERHWARPGQAPDGAPGS